MPGRGLHGHNVARKRYDAYIVPRRGLHSHYIALYQRQVVHILVISAPRIFETHLENVGRQVVGVILKPIRNVELEAALTHLGPRVARTGAAEFASAPHIEFSRT